MSKRALEVDAVSTPSKRTTVRRAMSSNKRALDEILAAEAPAATTATTKKRVRKSTLVDEDEVSEAPTPTVPRRKPAVKVDVDEVIEKKPAPRRNTERYDAMTDYAAICYWVHFFVFSCIRAAISPVHISQLLSVSFSLSTVHFA